MKPSTELFDLVKSLTKSEKRFFKLSSSLQSGEKNYLKIFDAIDKQSVYSEDALKEEFKNERFIKHFPSEKNHLYKLILKSLRSYHSDNSANSILKQEVKNIEILYRKALYKECGKFLSRAKKIALKNEKFYYLIDIIHWEKRLMEEALESGEFNRDLNDLIDEEQDYIERLKNLAEYQVLYSKINYLFRVGGFVKGDKQRKVVQQIAFHPLIKDSSMALSSRAKSICYYVRGFCCNAFRDNEGVVTNFTKAQIVLDENELIKKDLPKRYIRALTNIIYGHVNTRSYEKAETYLEIMKGLKGQSEFKTLDVEILLFVNQIMCELMIMNRKGEYEKALPMMNDMINELEIKRDKISKENIILFSYLISYIYFGAGKYKESLHWINQVLNDNENTLRQDIYTYARIFNLLIHYELGNYDLLEYIIKSTQRFLNKEPDHYSVEIRLVENLKKLAKNTTPENRIMIFEELAADYTNIFKTADDRVILEYINFKSWIFSKVEEKTFAEMCKVHGKQKQ